MATAYHILEPEVKQHVPSDIYEQQLGLMELALDAEGIAKVVRGIWDNASAE